MSLDLLKGLGVKIPYKAKYDNYINGKWIAPVKGEYFDVISPITGKNYTKAARSGAEDIELALDAAHAAADTAVRMHAFSLPWQTVQRLESA